MARKRKSAEPEKKPVANDYTDHAWCIRALESAQEADRDNRERARLAHDFVNSPNGQWETKWWRANDGKPRYTFDLTTPILKQIAGEIDEADYAIEVVAAGGNATDDDADLMAGIVRAIENHSDASTMVYKQAVDGSITSGLDGWRVVEDYVDADSFDMDLKIEWIPNFLDRVWLDESSEKRDGSDARHGWLMHALSPSDYEARWPGRDPLSASLGTDRGVTSKYWARRDVVIVGELFYIQDERKTLVKMSNGAIYHKDDKFSQVSDELANKGITIVQERERMIPCVYVRKFDAAGWLKEPEKTSFKHIPLVPEYQNFKIIDNKIVYHGEVLKLMDTQRVLNYSLSREIEEGALAPREKIWMTPEQQLGHEDTLATLNTNFDPVQSYNFDDRLGPNQITKTGGAVVNPGLRTISMAMTELFHHVSGHFSANMGDNERAQSGVAIKRLQDKGDNGTKGYMKGHEIALCHTYRIIAGAVPNVYDNAREVVIINEDATQELVKLNQTIYDQQSGKMVTLHDLTTGVYKTTCRAGPSFKSRQEELVNAILQASAADPTVLQLGADIFWQNLMQMPGGKMIAERYRRQLFNQGLIPPDQLTDAEKQELMIAQQQAAEQGQMPDPAMIIAQAEHINASATAEEKRAKAEQAMMSLMLQYRRENRADSSEAFKQQSESVRLMMEQQRQMMDSISSMAQTLKTIREAQGAEVAVTPSSVEAYARQSDALNSSLAQVGQPNVPHGTR